MGQSVSSEDSPRETCSGISKKTGERCTAPRAKGTDKCAGHLGLGIQAIDVKEAQRRSAVVRSAKSAERKKNVLDHIADAIQENAAEIARGYLDAGKKGDWRAYDALITRTFGKPIERTEISQELNVDSLTPEQRQALRGQVLEDYPELRRVA